MEMKPKKRQGLTARYAMVQCLYSLSCCCAQCFAAAFLLSRGLSNSQVGVTLTVGNALTILCQPAAASFADRTKRFALRNITAAMVAVSAVFLVLLLAIPAPALPTMALYALLMCFFGLYPPLITSMAMEQIDRGVPLNFSLARGFGSLAFAVLSLLMGFLVDRVGTWVILAVNLAASLANVCAVSLFPKAEGAPAERGKPQAQAAGLAAFARRNRRFMAAVLGVVLLYFSHVLINTYTIQIVRNVGGSNSDMGIALALGGFLELPAMALFPFLLKKLGSAGLILKLSGVFFVVKALLTLFASSVPVFYAAQCLQFFAFAMFIPASVYYTDRVVGGADQVKGQAAMGMAAIVSGMLGNAAGGFLLDAGGVRLMLAVGLAVSVAGLVLLLAAAPMDRAGSPGGPDQAAERRRKLMKKEGT